MNKFIKISLILSGVLMIAGFSFIVSGLVLSGGPGPLFSELRSGAYNFGNWHFEDGVYYKGKNKIDTTGIVNGMIGISPDEEDEFTERFAQEIIALKVDTDCANIEIKTADVQEITVHLKDGVLNAYESELDGNTLRIVYDLKTKSFSKEAEIEIEVPYGMEFDKVSAYTDLGGIEVNDLESEFLYLGSNLGNINYFGDVMVLEAETTMGNIEVELLGDEKEYDIEAETNLGTVTYNGSKIQGNLHCRYDKHHQHSLKSVILYSNMGNIDLNIDFHKKQH